MLYYTGALHTLLHNNRVEALICKSAIAHIFKSNGTCVVFTVMYDFMDKNLGTVYFHVYASLLYASYFHTSYDLHGYHCILCHINID